MGEVYAAHDCVLFPVRWEEPWGLVPLEAMAVGRPVVATGTGGSAEYLRDAGNCLLHPPGDAAALAQQLRAALALDPQARRRAGAQARAWVQANSDVDVETARMAGVIEGLRARRARAAGG
jgi:glycosyltransferase involved in cell wall biosynthesis